MKKVICIISCLASFGLLKAQDIESVSALKYSISPAELTFNFNDLYYGLNFGIENYHQDWGARLNFQFRPFYKKVQIPEINNITRQYHEKKYLMSIDVDKRLGRINISNQEFNFIIGSKFALLTGNYKGTRQDAENIWTIAPFAGLCVNIENELLLKAGYLHLKDGLVNVPDGKIFIGALILINK